MASPYRNLPARSFWKSGVAAQPQDLSALYSERFEIGPTARIATAGSCFAQHIAVRLKRHGYQVIDAEPPPLGLAFDISKQYGYNLYSARYGNIYTVRQLAQLIGETFGSFTPGEVVWEKDGRYYDALRPGVEPNGLDSPEEVLAHRAHHIRRVRQVFQKADILIFTMGLTEAWVHRASGTVFPTAPETIAGQFDPALYEFKNFGFDEVVADFSRVRKILKMRNPNFRFLLTVSPVPLTATATDRHVLVATTYSKSVLRAAAGALCEKFEDVDYFPSYEIIATPFVGAFYDSSLRSVTGEGVEKVMEVFFASRSVAAAPAKEAVKTDQAASAESDGQDGVACEEALLDAFAR